MFPCGPGLRRGLEWLKNCLVAAGREMVRQKPCHQGVQRLLVVFESETFQELLAGPSMEAAQQAELGRWPLSS